MAGLVPGQVLEGTAYQVVREIGAGGMGVVYEVEHVRLRKRYVAKIIHEQIRGDEAATKRMEREAHVLAELNHPNVVQVHDVGTTSDGTSYFVMEKLEGIDLGHAMKRGGITPARALAIVIDILGALAHVHERGLVHRDIKPANVFLARMPSGGTTTKVLDFGIVHIFDGDRSSQGRITKTGGFVGTLYYAAPEQMAGRPAGPPNDVYACGLVLFELLTGRGPFDQDPGVGLSRCFRPAPRLPETIAPQLADAVASALEQEPEKRPSAAGFAAKLREILLTLPTDPGPNPVSDDVDDLLSNIGQTGGAGHTGIGTKAPPTPLMAGAPARAQTAPLGAPSASAVPSPITPHAPPASRPTPSPSVPYAATLASPARTQVPQGDTSGGVASNLASTSVRVAPVSKGVIAGALVAAFAVLGGITFAGISVVRAARGTNASAPVLAVSALPAEARPTASPSPSTPVVAEPAAAPAAPEPAASTTLAEQAPAASAAAPSSAAAKPAPARKHVNAEKDGYFNDL